MAKITLYRRPDSGTICLRFANGPGDCARYSLPVKVDAKQWDGQQITAAHPRRQELNLYLSGILTRARAKYIVLLRFAYANTIHANYLSKILTAIGWTASKRI